MGDSEAAFSQVPTTSPVMIKHTEQTSRNENPPVAQNPTAQPMSFSDPDFEGSAHVSSEFRYGINASRPYEDICTGNEPMLGGIGRTQHLLDEMHRLNLNNPPFVHNPMTQPMKLSASDIEGRAQVSSEVESLYEFSYGMNASSKPAEHIHTGNEPMLGGLGGTKYLLDRRHRPLSLNIPSPSEDPNLGYELSSNKEENVGMGLLKTGNYRDNSINKLLPGVRYKDLIGKEFPSNRQDRDFNLNDTSNKHVVDVAKQLLSGCYENIQQDKNPECTFNDISVEYLKLYQETSPENYDFAMNIMAHIEFLNDSSWTTTVSYLDENVKRIVTRLWNNLHITFSNTIKLQGFNRNNVLKLMMDFNQWSIVEKFEFDLFLSCCVLLCHLGIIARKRVSKDASFYAICLLRARMKVLKFENLVQYMFDIVLKDYAKRQCKV